MAQRLWRALRHTEREHVPIWQIKYFLELKRTQRSRDYSYPPLSSQFAHKFLHEKSPKARPFCMQLISRFLFIWFARSIVGAESEWQRSENEWSVMNRKRAQIRCGSI